MCAVAWAPKMLSGPFFHGRSAVSSSDTCAPASAFSSFAPPIVSIGASVISSAGSCGGISTRSLAALRSTTEHSAHQQLDQYGAAGCALQGGPLQPASSSEPGHKPLSAGYSKARQLSGDVTTGLAIKHNAAVHVKLSPSLCHPQVERTLLTAMASGRAASFSNQPRRLSAACSAW